MKRILRGLLICTCILGLMSCAQTQNPELVAEEKMETEKTLLTLDDVIRISKKGENITWDDFKDFKNEDIGSGLWVYKFEIDDEYHLIISGNKEYEPNYIYLVDKAKNQINVKTENVEEILKSK